LNARKIFEIKKVLVASVSQGKRYAERWCAARVFPNLPLREAAARLTDTTPINRHRHRPACHQPVSSSNRLGAWKRRSSPLLRDSMMPWNQAAVGAIDVN